ncbi:hypothetical protein F5876DRAFT_80171 [Lentinula aff. lateritia]|uniref:Uncharacterized protein n=1 Tax=Lentinula aff. lateritia TaxID=2804960 RepID=A0ACC1TQD7_9AGAR|nr:hypothetical protein F5876DRAFT_80171 [Lentinula aff. lateritia]
MALKILTCESTKSLQASDAKKRSDELDMLQKIATAQPSHRDFEYNLILHDSFEFQGPHGQHICLVADVLDYSCVTKQILCSLEYLHDVCGIVHTDIKHDNILFRLSDVEAIVAHGLTTEPSVSYDGGPGVIVVPSFSQPLPLSLEDTTPTTHLKAVPADAGYFTEFLMRFWLFEFSSHRDKWGAEEDHLVRMTEALATNFDPTFLSKCKYSQKFFNSDGCWKNFTSHKEPTWVLEELLAEFAFVDLGKNEERANARELFEDPWLADD